MHTTEPWSVCATFDNDGTPETVICGLDGEANIAVALDFGPNNPELRDQNAQRIVACVNFCEGVSNQVLGISTLERISELAVKSMIKNQELSAENARLKAELDRVTKLNPIDEWHEDDHSVLWFTVPIEEPPIYIGSPLDDDFPDYVTHFAHMPLFVCPIKDHGSTDEGATMLAKMTPPDIK